MNTLPSIAIPIALAASGTAFAQDEATCPILHSSFWDIRLARMVEDGTSRLVIFGQVDMPSAGYTVTLEAGPMDRASPPRRRVRVIASAPPGAAAPVITSHTIATTLPSPITTYRSVKIICGDTVLFEALAVLLPETRR